ncbi:MAG TPA: type IX secretion system protein PorQ [Flavobacteriia bacterium]|nr:type IX secretion system protein PorQ [Flavobacteriia bacterium]
MEFSYSQVGGEQIYNFLNVTTSARQASLGGKSLTMLNDVNQPLWNPAVINQNLDNKLSINYLNYLADINYGSVSYSRFFDKHFGSLFINLTYVDYGKFIEADSDGIILGNFNSRDLLLNVGYARNLPWSNFYIGINFKLISSSIKNYSSYGIASDIALLYHNDTKPYRITAVVRNFGYQLSIFDDKKERLPLDVLLGFSYDLENLPLRWYVTIDNLQQWNISFANPSDINNSISSGTKSSKVGFVGNAIRHFVIGTEFFPKGKFNLRLGYNFRRARELRLVERRTFSGLNFGFGLKMGRYKLHYAFSKYHPSSNTSTFSLDINLDSNIR